MFCLALVLKILDLDILDEVVPVHSDEAVTMANELWMIGLPVGVSSGGESMVNNVAIMEGWTMNLHLT